MIVMFNKYFINLLNPYFIFLHMKKLNKKYLLIFNIKNTIIFYKKIAWGVFNLV